MEVGAAAEGGIRVLLVEDQRVNQKVIGRILERLGCHVDVAPDGELGVELVKGRPALVLMDCSMPRCDGFEATRRIREMPAGLAGTPIVALTAHATAADRVRCLASGMDDWITKPVQPDELVAILRKYTAWTPAAATPLVEEVVDRAVVETLVGLGGPDDPDFFRDLVADFRGVAEAALADARVEHAEGRFGDLRRTAHRLRGACATVGAVRLREACARLEAASDEEIAVAGPALLADAEHEARLAAAALDTSHWAAA